MSDKKDNNVIEFPVDKIKSRKHRMLIKMRQQKFIFSTSLASVLLVMAIANSNMFNDSRNRGIASSEDYKLQQENQKKILKLLKKNDRGIASIGSKSPSIEDRLRFEVLDGRYALRFNNNNKVKEIDFASTSSGFSTPKFIDNYESLLREYKNILAVDFSELELLEIEKTQDGKLVQKIQLKTDVSKVGEVDVKMDKYGRLLNLKVLKVVEQPELVEEAKPESPGESTPTSL